MRGIPKQLQHLAFAQLKNQILKLFRYIKRREKMFLDDIPINLLGVLVAAILYFIIGLIWYAPFAFGRKKNRDEKDIPIEKETRIGAYLGEMIVALIIAYILALFIQISQAAEFVEGVMVSVWIWLGFVATTHFSAVLWARKTFGHFIIHASFMLVGFIAMACAIMYFGF